MKYIVTFEETYSAFFEHEVEAKSEQEAIEKGEELQGKKRETSKYDISFIEWFVVGVETNN